MKKTISLFLFLFIACLELSAQDRYMVFFTDKQNSSYTTNAPQAFLSVRAIQRRQTQNIPVVENDLPVSQSYISALQNLGIEVYHSSKWMNAVLVQMDDISAASVLALSFVNTVEYVAPGAILSKNTNGDEFTSAQTTEISASAFQNEMLAIDVMHEEGFRGEGVLVAIMDDGFSNISQLQPLQHLFASHQILSTKDFVLNRKNVETEFSHGTRVLSIMASDAPDNIVGVVPDADYLLYVTEAPGEYRIEEYNWLFAAEMADSAGADVINTSLGYSIFDDASMDYTYADMDGETTVISRAANLAASKGMMIVNSAGNSGNDAWRYITAPSDSRGVLSIGAVDFTEERASFSSIGPSADGRIKPDVSALGVGTAVVTASGSVAHQNGTSFSSPIVAGFAAGLRQAFPNLTNFELYDLIRASSSQYETPNVEVGYGIPNFERAYQLGLELQEPIESGVEVYPNPTMEGEITVAFEASYFEEAVTLSLMDKNGSSIQNYQVSPSLLHNRIQLDLSNQSAGVYLLRISGREGTLTKKIIKY